MNYNEGYANFQDTEKKDFKKIFFATITIVAFFETSLNSEISSTYLKSFTGAFYDIAHL